ncbi:MAG: tRNA pseudouridine(38-40) synthase TruA [Desulfuromonadales bacterium]|nr:tRNA pseudouridine(38-40) synthase TruA [Desulfuromonadales bacterium]
MRKIRLLLEFDGTRFAGWQWQANGLSVQQVVEAALQKITGETVRLVSSGRTDAGVHARGMVAHFTTSRDLPLSAFREGVNRYLPPDVAVRQAAEAPPDFHARHSAEGKWYRYTICLSPVRLPLVARGAWQIRSPLDLEAMRRGAGAFCGRHDFGAFRAGDCNARGTIREIFSLELIPEGELLYLDVRGSGFLRTMVRVMVGTLVEIGLGKRPWTDVERLLLQGQRIEAGLTAPAQGLCLMEVWY